jgi:transposase InsO family protein
MRGKTSKVTAEMVGRILEKAKDYKRIRLKRFSADLKKHQDIEVGVKTLEEILIANDLYKARTRKKRPRYYQSLCQKIPNGLLSIDGSQVIVWLGNTPYPFNVELAVDVATFAHTAFSIADTETAEEVIKILRAHRRDWGIPIGILSDSGRANLSAAVKGYMKELGIESVPAGPANPKGNGTDEGAFSHMKRVLGHIRLDASSSKALARSVLEVLISVYIQMRNRLCVYNRTSPPGWHMREPVSAEIRNAERLRLKEHVAAKTAGGEDQLKLDRLNWIIHHYDLEAAPDALKRAERTIKGYELEAIRLTETAFLKATRRKANRRCFAYFFGILKNIQQLRDDDARKEYCRQRYNHEVMIGLERQKNEQPKPASINSILNMLEKAVTINVQFVKELAIRKARQWTLELVAACRYSGPIKKKFENILGSLKHLSIEQREKIWEIFCEFLKTNEPGSRVTQFS